MPPASRSTNPALLQHSAWFTWYIPLCVVEWGAKGGGGQLLELQVILR